MRKPKLVFEQTTERCTLSNTISDTGSRKRRGCAAASRRRQPRNNSHSRDIINCANHCVISVQISRRILCNVITVSLQVLFARFDILQYVFSRYIVSKIVNVTGVCRDSQLFVAVQLRSQCFSAILVRDNAAFVANGIFDHGTIFCAGHVRTYKRFNIILCVCIKIIIDCVCKAQGNRNKAAFSSLPRSLRRSLNNSPSFLFRHWFYAARLVRSTRFIAFGILRHYLTNAVAGNFNCVKHVIRFSIVLYRRLSFAAGLHSVLVQLVEFLHGRIVFVDLFICCRFCAFLRTRSKLRITLIKLGEILEAKISCRAHILVVHAHCRLLYIAGNNTRRTGSEFHPR